MKSRLDDHVPGNQPELPVDFGDGEAVLIGAVKDQERLLLFANFPEALKMRGRILQLDSLENDRLSGSRRVLQNLPLLPHIPFSYLSPECRTP